MYNNALLIKGVLFVCLFLCVLTSCLSFVSILNFIRHQCLTLIIYHVVVNIITIVHIS